MEIYSSSEQVIQACVAHLDNNENDVWLATVVGTWGSSPRPPGATLMWSSNSGPVGSVSGGCVEEALIAQFKQDKFCKDHPTIVRYGDPLSETVSATSSFATEKVQLPCGGILTLLVEHLAPDHAARWRELAESIRSRRGIARTVDLQSGTWEWQQSKPFKAETDNNSFRVYLGPKRKLLIIGANQIAYHLAHFAIPLEFDVTVCDPSDDVGEYWCSSDIHLIRRYPDGFVDAQFNDSSCAIVAVSHDPRLDDMALLEALPSKAFYIGAMGSQRSSAARRERLRQLDVPEMLLQKLHAPIGVSIGSKSPAEIALSIAADLVKHAQYSYG
ncbi:xanthine dehydrogenase accessory factor [Alteromonadaceae bacterium 2753L.S.0a.02]|nr:xanthine dehydrogenase accessory factor [Alteromonadaceae bacterium 2753L.S.0a.02]